jgi:hypothetical protein
MDLWMCMVDFVHDFAYHLSLASLLHAKSLTANECMRACDTVSHSSAQFIYMSHLYVSNNV